MVSPKSADHVLKLAKRLEREMHQEGLKHDLNDLDYAILTAVMRALALQRLSKKVRAQSHLASQCAESLVNAESGVVRGEA